ncbi:MAG: DUF1080 domain-containing protein [Saprospiraceae bacterium]|nr:DUF1080 domain-containing protein [Saprospiraceae bacterium]MCB9320760.1 DUF1080 domain-containing protein [Lewinellaceae bacterium]
MMTFHTRLEALYPLILLFLMAALWTACGTSEQSGGEELGSENEVPTMADAGWTPTPEEQEAGWIALFNGEDLNSWKGFGVDTIPSGWVAEHGMLVLRAPDELMGGMRGDLISRDTFSNFEFSLEAMLSDSANSGIFIRVPDDASRLMWQWSPEMQLIDDVVYNSWLGEDQMMKHHSGDCYDLYEAEPGLASSIGSWNSIRILALGSHIQYWLNGRLAVSFDMASADWKKRVARSKFAPFPQFAKTGTGHIGLQDHEHAMRFRNLMIRRISE